MRPWYKYSTNSSHCGRTYIPIDRSYNDHKKSMDGFEADNSYSDKKAFFNRHFHNSYRNRLIYYDNFIRKHVTKEDDILSIGSGRCVNELLLLEDGYSIVCSDLDQLGAYKMTKQLFPNFQFKKFDILKNSSQEKYNVILCLSLIYLFNAEELNKFFMNVRNSLTKEGFLILDSAGSPDNLLSHFIHEELLKYETKTKAFIKTIRTPRKEILITKHTGYRRKDREIINSAKLSGFILCDQENYDFLTELCRSYLLNRLIESFSSMEKVFCLIGRHIPYIRMFKFKRDG